jgi:peptidoglycan/xylan/chitin deacetylase (PgdA/CDA1 family)
MRPLVRTAVSVGAHLSGFSRLVAARYRGRGLIFALHSVVDDDTVRPDRTLRCPATRLEWALRWLRDEELDFIGLDEGVRRLREENPRPFACFAFDDGYADNLTLALPIMERFAAPFTVYVTTGMITREIDAWWLGLAALVRSRDKVELPAARLRFDCPDPARKQLAFRTIESLLHKDFSLLPHLREAIAQSAIDCRALVDREALSEGQLRRLARHPLVTIGGHTTTHRNLAEASAPTVRAELADNRKFLQDATGQPVEHFAYPFGHERACGEREARICRDLGFRTAVTTRAGALFADHASDLHTLPRMHLAGDDTSSTLRCKVDGVYRAIHSRFGDPVARL